MDEGDRMPKRENDYDSDNVGRKASGFVARAQRFRIQTLVYYRESGKTAWEEGTTLNISRTGILFQTKTDLPLQTTIQIRITLPHEITGEAPAEIVCWGPVVRKELLASPVGQHALAATISRYAFSYKK